MKLSSLKNIIKEELRLIKRYNKPSKGCGKSRLMEADPLPGNCMARVNGVEVPCNADCHPTSGCGGEVFSFQIGSGDRQEAICECHTGAAGLTGLPSDTSRERTR